MVLYRTFAIIFPVAEKILINESSSTNYSICSTSEIRTSLHLDRFDITRDPLENRFCEPKIRASEVRAKQYVTM